MSICIVRTPCARLGSGVCAPGTRTFRRLVPIGAVVKLVNSIKRKIQFRTNLKAEKKE